jgi:hypothetical protein
MSNYESSPIYFKKSQNNTQVFSQLTDKYIIRSEANMYKLVIRDINNNILDQRFFMRQPEESHIQAYWVESLKKHGALIMLQNEKVKYIDMAA